MNVKFRLLPAAMLSLVLGACTVVATSPIDVALEKARQLAGDDKYLQVTERLQCNEAPTVEELSGARPYAENVIAEPMRIYDNLYYIGGIRTGSWLLTGSDGYIMIDAMYGDSPEEVLIPGMRKLGLDPAKLKYILITHAEPDHAGGAKYFQETYGTRIVMSQQDWDGILAPKFGSWVLNTAPKAERPPQEREWLGPPKMDLVGHDGETLTLGDIAITMIFAPRRAHGGGLSFIASVTDNGEPHTWATYGNAGAPRSIADRQLHRRSIKHFMDYMNKASVDSITSSHPFVDGSLESMKELKGRKGDEANPFVIGQDMANNYMNILDQCTAMKIARNEAGLDDFGRMKR